MSNTDLVLFTSQDESVSLSVSIEDETVWLSLDQLTHLFHRDKSSVSRHVNNIFKENELDRNAVVAKFATTAADGKTYDVTFYNLDVIISVGYRVKSQRGIEFRRWATGVLRDYTLKGYAQNELRLEQLGQAIQLLERIPSSLDSKQILDVVKSYTKALDMPDDYDHQKLTKPKGENATYVISYEECRSVIDQMKFGAESDLFGNEEKEVMVALVMNFLV